MNRHALAVSLLAASLASAACADRSADADLTPGQDVVTTRDCPLFFEPVGEGSGAADLPSGSLLRVRADRQVYPGEPEARMVRVVILDGPDKDKVGLVIRDFVRAKPGG